MEFVSFLIVGPLEFSRPRDTRRRRRSCSLVRSSGRRFDLFPPGLYPPNPVGCKADHAGLDLET